MEWMRDRLLKIGVLREAAPELAKGGLVGPDGPELLLGLNARETPRADAEAQPRGRPWTKPRLIIGEMPGHRPPTEAERMDLALIQKAADDFQRALARLEERGGPSDALAFARARSTEAVTWATRHITA